MCATPSSLACVILFLFLRDWRSSLIAGLVIPVTVAVTVLVLWLIGESFNLMTLGGLAAAIGLVIDDAIVVVEKIVLHRDAGEGPVDAVRHALHEIIHPLIGSTITPVVVFLPLISVTGVTGSFFRALAITMAVSLLTSLLLAVTWTPGLAMVLLKPHKGSEGTAKATPGSALEHPAPTGLLGRIAHRARTPRRTGVVAAPPYLPRPALPGPGGWQLLRVQTAGLRPAARNGRGRLYSGLRHACRSSLPSTGRVLDRVEQILRHTPEVESPSRRTGLQLGLAAVTESNTGDISVKLKAKRSRGIDEIMADIRGQIKQQEPQLDIEFTQTLQDMIGDLSNSPEPIQIKLFTPDTAMLNQLAARPAGGRAIKTVNGVVDVQNGIDNTISGPATDFAVDPQLAGRLGFTPQEVAEDATAILDGLEVATPSSATAVPTRCAFAWAAKRVSRSTPSATPSSTPTPATRPHSAL